MRGDKMKNYKKAIRMLLSLSIVLTFLLNCKIIAKGESVPSIMSAEELTARAGQRYVSYSFFVQNVGKLRISYDKALITVPDDSTNLYCAIGEKIDTDNHYIEIDAGHSSEKMRYNLHFDIPNTLISNIYPIRLVALNNDNDVEIKDGFIKVDAESSVIDSGEYDEGGLFSKNKLQWKLLKNGILQLSCREPRLLRLNNYFKHYVEDVKKVEISDHFTSIDPSTFSGWTNLESVTIADSITKIGNSAFNSCTSLQSIIIPESVETIDSLAFDNCTKLTSITICNPQCRISNLEGTICNIKPKTHGDSVYNGIIYGYADSTAEKYATAFNRDFRIIDFLLGDFNDDGKIGVEDSQLTLRAYTERFAGLENKLSFRQMKAVDINNDGIISVEDAQLILRYYTENIVAGNDIAWDILLNL